MSWSTAVRLSAILRAASGDEEAATDPTHVRSHEYQVEDAIINSKKTMSLAFFEKTRNSIYVLEGRETLMPVRWTPTRKGASQELVGITAFGFSSDMLSVDYLNRIGSRRYKI